MVYAFQLVCCVKFTEDILTMEGPAEVSLLLREYGYYARDCIVDIAHACLSVFARSRSQGPILLLQCLFLATKASFEIYIS